MLDDDGVAERVHDLRWILLDVDGVLTDGLLHYSAENGEVVTFHTRDGLGLGLARSAGLRVGLLSGRANPAVERRARDLDLDLTMLGEDDKGAAYTDLLHRHDLRDREVAAMGDDLTDLPVLTRCGLSFAPADAAAEVRDVVDRVVEADGGHGAVREMIELILDRRGDWDRLVGRFSD